MSFKPSKRLFLSCVFLVTLSFCFWVGSHPVIAKTYASLRFYDSSNGSLLAQYNGDSDRLTMPWASNISVQVADVSRKTGKMRLSSGACGSGSQTDESAPFEFTIEPRSADSQCSLLLEGWKSRTWNWQGRERLTVSFSSSSPAPPTPRREEPEEQPIRPRPSVREEQPIETPVRVRRSSNTYASLRFFDASNNTLLGRYDGQDRLTVPMADEVSVRVEVDSSTQKMRLTSGNCAGSQTDDSAPFEFTLEPSANGQCVLELQGWANGWNWQWREQLTVSFSSSNASPVRQRREPQEETPVQPRPVETPVVRQPQPPERPAPTRPVARVTPAPSGGSSTLYRITQGTSGRTSMTGSSATRPSHGVRIYCPPSHFAYDDPVIFPNQPGKSHLHIFIGNTEAKASSTPSSLLNGGNSSCEGGVNVRSSYWTPAVMSQGQPVIPASAWIYYKTFMANTNFNDLQRVPNGLQMLALSSTKGYKNQLSIQRSTFNTHTKKQSMKLTAGFPNCIATKNGRWNGEPILDYRDMPGQASQIVNSHVAYAENSSDLNHLGCPKTHPYRIPTMSIHQYYHLDDLKGGWKLASDIERGTGSGATFHADYIAAWDDSTMRVITDCNRFARNCEFRGRTQLSERLRSPGNHQVYDYSHIVRPGTDMTPFGSMSAKL